MWKNKELLCTYSWELMKTIRERKTKIKHSQAEVWKGIHRHRIISHTSTNQYIRHSWVVACFGKTFKRSSSSIYISCSEHWQSLVPHVLPAVYFSNILHWYGGFSFSLLFCTPGYGRIFCVNRFLHHIRFAILCSSWVLVSETASRLNCYIRLFTTHDGILWYFDQCLY